MLTREQKATLGVVLLVLLGLAMGISYALHHSPATNAADPFAGLTLREQAVAQSQPRDILRFWDTTTVCVVTGMVRGGRPAKEWKVYYRCGLADSDHLDNVEHLGERLLGPDGVVRPYHEDGGVSYRSLATVYFGQGNLPKF